MDLTEIDHIAAEQRGLITYDQAIEALGRRRKERWVAAGRLVPIQPKVWRLAGAPNTWKQQLLAAQLSSRGRVTHRPGAHLWGLLRGTSVVEVSAPIRRNPRLFAPAIVHRIVDLEDSSPVELDGFLVSDPARTIVDLGLVVPPHLVADALSVGLTRGLVTLDDAWQIRARLSKCGRNGVGVLDAVLRERSDQPGVEESVLEERMLRLLRRGGLPGPVLQHEIWSGGRLVARVDLAYPAAKLAIELDGYGHHSSPEAFQRDRTRQNELVDLGWTVLRFTWNDVVRRPDEVLATIGRALRRAAA